jgi:AcrR family transcriptional regulator
VSASSGLRERKKLETRAALQDAALRLAVEAGPDKVTIEAVAEAAGVSPRTFFNYFPSKDDAIIGVPASSASTLLTELRSRPGDEPPLVALRETIRASIARLQEDPDRWALRTQLVQRYPDLGARFASRMTELEHELAAELARRTGLDPGRDVYPAAAVGAVMGCVRAAMTLWREHEPAPLEELLEQVFTYLDHSLAQPGQDSSTRAQSD